MGLGYRRRHSLGAGQKGIQQLNASDSRTLSLSRYSILCTIIVVLAYWIIKARTARVKILPLQNPIDESPVDHQPQKGSFGS